ncbi:MAG: (2Fe-2S)-binding protein [bacterium]|nr:MAG: (2Fe-2S)-binding protein [bacterium]
MQSQVTLTIDGSTVRAPKGASVLEAALSYSICIPHLCHLPTLSDVGACRLCIVEHAMNGRSKITTSCTLLVQEGMVIHANSDRVRSLRRNIAELLVAQAPNSRAIQDIAMRCGVKEVRYPFRQDDCILCGRCVRTCKESYRANAIDFVGRGRERRVDYPYGERPESCVMCRACVSLCPMAITPCDGPMKPGEEYLCGKCESVTQTPQYSVGDCIRCDLGKGFDCVRHR